MRQRRRYGGWGRRAALGGWVAAVVVLIGAGPALADSATLSVTTTTGASDPVAGVGRVFTLSGSSAVPSRIWVKYRPAGGAPCAPSALTDSGTKLFQFIFYGEDVNGTIDIAQASTWSLPGTFVFCFWIAPTESAVATPFTQAITFRAPTGTVTATIDPIIPLVGQTAAITVTGASEAPAQVFATVRAAGGAGCAPTYGADTGSSVLSGSAVDGAFSIPATTTQSTAGNYVLCLWLAQSSSDPRPIAGPQPQPFTVVAPPPPLPLPPPPESITASTTVRRAAARYSGRIVSRADCRSRRTVVLRRSGSGTRTFGRAVSRTNGTFTIRRSRRLRGRVYVVVLPRTQGVVTCRSARSFTIRG